MKRFGVSSGGKLAIYIIGALLLIFSGYRTIDLVRRTLPEEAWLLAWVAIVAFDGGIIAWLYFLQRGAESWEQTAIGTALVVLDFIGVSIFFALHTLITQSLFPVDTAVFGPWVVAALGAVVLSNIAGVLTVHFYDPDQALLRARRDAQIQVNERAVERVRESAPKLADELAPALADRTLSEARSLLTAPRPRNGKGERIFEERVDSPTRPPARS